MDPKNVLASSIAVLILVAYIVIGIWAAFEFFQANGDHRTHDMIFWGFIVVFIGMGPSAVRSKS